MQQELLKPTLDDSDRGYTCLERDDAAIVFLEEELKLIVPNYDEADLKKEHIAVAIAIYLRLLDENEGKWRADLCSWMNDVGRDQWRELIKDAKGRNKMMMH